MTELGPYGRELMRLTSNIEQEAQRRLNSTLRTRELRYYWIGPIRYFTRDIVSPPHAGYWYLYNQYGALMVWVNTVSGSCAVFNPKLMKFKFTRTGLRISDYYTFDENGAARFDKYTIMPVGDRLSTHTHDEDVLARYSYSNEIETNMSLGEVRRRIGDIHLLVEAYEDGRGPAWFEWPHRGMLTRERLDAFIMSIPDSKLTSRPNLW